MPGPDTSPSPESVISMNFFDIFIVILPGIKFDRAEYTNIVVNQIKEKSVQWAVCC